MAIKISKVIAELNVGRQAIEEFLQSKGISIDSSINARIEFNVYEMLVKHFQPEVAETLLSKLKQTKEYQLYAAQNKREKLEDAPMAYPLISEYIEAIKYAEENFATLTDLRSVLDSEGNPIMSSGNFAVIFKMRDERDGKFYALKCFIKDQDGRNEAYKQIADELEFVSSEFIIPIKFFEKELFVNTSNSDETEFPVLLMDWVEGVTLDKYVRAHLHDQYALQLVSFQFCRIAAWLMAQPFAHGDLKPDNILVMDDGFLVLVDYDGMFVPAMRGQKAREIGSPDYRHPLRTINDFNEHIDDFSLATIAMQLYAIALQPELLTSTIGDTLLLCEKDYRDLEKSETMTKLFSQIGSPEFEKLLAVFLLAHSDNTLSKVSFRIFNITKPTKIILRPLPAETTQEDVDNGIDDGYGGVYSQDWRRLLYGPDITSYQIKPGTQVICDGAFFQNNELKEIRIPDSIAHIGEEAFYDCISLENIIIPNSVTHIGTGAFSGCGRLFNIIIPDSVSEIGHSAFAWCERLNSISIPNSVMQIGDGAFDGCEKLTSIIIPNGSMQRFQELLYAYSDKLIEEDDWSFSHKTEVTSEEIVNGVTDEFGAVYSSNWRRLLKGPDIHSYEIKAGTIAICDRAFEGCKELTAITIPNSIKTIGTYAFINCGLTRVNVTDITAWCNILFISYYSNPLESAHRLFLNGTEIKYLVIPSSVSIIGESAFYGCSGLTNIIIPDSVTTISDKAFWGCSGLTNIHIPHSVTTIGKYAFKECRGLTSMVLPDSVTTIGREIFSLCSNLTRVTISNSVTEITDGMFFECRNLNNIIIPNSVTTIGERAFEGCTKLTNITIPDSVKDIDIDAFWGTGIKL